MLLCLDIGNTQVHGGVFEGDALRAQFRKSTYPLGSSDELGIFFTTVLRESTIPPASIDSIALCSVVPAALPALRDACDKYFKAEPFILQGGVKTGLKITYRNPAEVGADRIAGAIAASHRYPGKDILVVDCGTATTFDVVTGTGEYLGGAILPGMEVSADALATRTAKLPRIEILRPTSALGRSTTESIQSGIYFGQVGAIRHLTFRLAREVFAGTPKIIGTGGHARLFESERLFEEIVPELVLLGLRRAWLLNTAP